jgi:hypothetical protein
MQVRPLCLLIPSTEPSLGCSRQWLIVASTKVASHDHRDASLLAVKLKSQGKHE